MKQVILQLVLIHVKQYNNLITNIKIWFMYNENVLSILKRIQ